MIKTVIFDMGGVIITLDENKAGKRFVELGMKEFAEKMDPYKQVGLNGQLEEGKISEEEYRRTRRRRGAGYGASANGRS